MAAGTEPDSRLDEGSSTYAPPSLETAHVLFMDIVGYSLLPMDRQSHVLHLLQLAVSATAAFRRAQAESQLISLPTGDGMALVFFRDPLAPVECAVELSRALRGRGEIPLRMGINSGPVYRVADINANRNVAGGGINMAQRVMDCGDTGHILLSRSAAETLSQLSQWASHIQDLGEQEVKHGVRIRVYNLALEDAGNPQLPKKLAVAAASKQVAGVSGHTTRKFGIWAGVGAVILLLVVSAVWIGSRQQELLPAPAAAVQPSRSFSYSILVQQYRNGAPYRDPFVLPGEMIFQPDYRIRLQVTSSQSGRLYVLNQGPESAGGLASYHILFPASGESAALEPSQLIQIPEGEENWFVFDEQQGTEQLWLIWSAQPLEIFEAAKSFGDATHQGVVSDAALVQQIHAFLEQHRSAEVRSVREDANRRTMVSGAADVLAKLVRLEHH